jgi:hypothetical protein
MILMIMEPLVGRHWPAYALFYANPEWKMVSALIGAENNLWQPEHELRFLRR